MNPEITSKLSLITGQNIRCTPHGLEIDGVLMDFEQWEDILRHIHNIRSAYHCILGDHIHYGRDRFGVARVSVALEQNEFDFSDVAKADSIGQLSLSFRENHKLSSEHYFTLSKVESERERERWASIAAREKLSPLELKRSIEAGKILHTNQISSGSGQGSGINTIQGAVFRMQQWERTMGGAEKIAQLPIEQRKNLLSLLTPMIQLAATIEESLSK